VARDRFGEEWSSVKSSIRTVHPFTDRTICQRPDVDEPRLRCGHPVPCPRHTAVIALDGVAWQTYYPAALLDVRAMRRIQEIARALVRGRPEAAATSWRRGIWSRG